MTTATHPSCFALDVYFASRDAGAAENEPASPIAKHVASCARCASYLAELEALDAQGDARLPPRALRVTPPSRSRRLLGQIAPAAAIAALAAVVIVYVRGRSASDDAQYLGVKGMPAAQVLVRSDGQTRVWDARSPVRAGDSLAVHVACEQFRHVTVASAPPGGGLVRLSDGPCPTTPDTLPFTLLVDDQPGQERLLVVLAQSRLDDAALAAAVRVSSRSAGVWVAAFELAKEERR